MTTVVLPPSRAADQNLKRRIMNYLHACGVYSPEQLQIDVQGGNVVICGDFPSLQEARVCLECCRRVAGVLHVRVDV